MTIVFQPQNDAEAEERIEERQRREDAKRRLTQLYDGLVAACPGVRVTRALFDSRIKDLVGDRSPAQLGIDLDLIPAVGSPEEDLLFRRYDLAYDVAICAKRRSIMDRDISLAIKHLTGP
ncbi:hypothetical protein AVEN_123561-1 [Araneus ventricosus]|uniref:Uncharacterized protein n=1 Tax=Araneus ventricosus TaxID=182803 RepID=A0A4Y2JWR0_ARAVE|nr:hypothetical protein AVEN_123561-1 [Araneus ventricosus]